MITACPNSTASGCRCAEHHPGLAEYASDPVAFDAALERVRARDTVRLQVVTLPPFSGPVCDGKMTCSCESCLQERAARREAPRVRQPWEARPARRSARAA